MGSAGNIATSQGQKEIADGKSSKVRRKGKRHTEPAGKEGSRSDEWAYFSPRGRRALPCHVSLVRLVLEQGRHTGMERMMITKSSSVSGTCALRDHACQTRRLGPWRSLPWACPFSAFRSGKVVCPVRMSHKRKTPLPVVHTRNAKAQILIEGTPINSHTKSMVSSIPLHRKSRQAYMGDQSSDRHHLSLRPTLPCPGTPCHKNAHHMPG
ncbi:hypothetical protein F5148DRAFT_168058 [Russula earlei]|uniref:Uncharacterized protein n=1 Tax=Russula earlei TaxID=71964 RepID=A0ACC0U5T9_9AGAM|nr:hypothetical protein F5148DRAFT_168058 [Russula earlei]